MNDVVELSKKIEDMRLKLQQTALCHETLYQDEVLYLSRLLDDLILLHYQQNKSSNYVNRVASL